jgi:LacI family transcriptional regulator
MELIFTEIQRFNRKNILFLEGLSSSWDSACRKRILSDLCRDADFMRLDTLPCGFNAKEAYSGVGKLLKEYPNYDCIVASNDEMAIGAMKAVRESGYSIPDDIMIIGFDNIESSHWIEPSLTTIEIDYRELGRRIGQEILALIIDKKQVRNKKVFPVSLIRRNTTGI